MKAICFRARGGPAELVLQDLPTPQPGAGEVLIKVHAAAVTPTELLWAPTWTTRMGEARPFPIIPGHEFSGEVCALGAEVADAASGDAVFGLNDWFRDGAQAEYCVARANDIASRPRSLDHVQAASVPISALTAWQGLIERAHVGAGQRVLVHGASGGVGVFAIQIARRRGAHVIGTASGRNLAFVRDLGADEVIDYRIMRFDEVLSPMDVVFDTVGGETLARSWGVLRPGGTLVTVATSEESVQEERVRQAFFIVEPKREQLAEIARLIDAGELRPVVGAVFPLAQARQAYEHKAARGKTVLRVVD